MTVLEALNEAYLIARGHEQGDGFKRLGTSQMYWKGRSDAATEIRDYAAKLLEIDLHLEAVRVESKVGGQS